MILALYVLNSRKKITTMKTATILFTMAFGLAVVTSCEEGTRDVDNTEMNEQDRDNMYSQDRENTSTYDDDNSMNDGMDGDNMNGNGSYSDNGSNNQGQSQMASMDFEEMDQNKDAKVDQNEYNTSANRVNEYNTWDWNSDQNVDEEEYVAVFMTRYDTDDDDKISKEEMDKIPIKKDGPLFKWEDWDTNDDDQLSQIEFQQGMDKGKYYDKADTNNDGNLSSEEINNMSFTMADNDSDGNLTEEEYDEYNKPLIKQDS